MYISNHYCAYIYCTDRKRSMTTRKIHSLSSFNWQHNSYGTLDSNTVLHRFRRDQRIILQLPEKSSHMHSYSTERKKIHDHRKSPYTVVITESIISTLESNSIYHQSLLYRPEKYTTTRKIQRMALNQQEIVCDHRNSAAWLTRTGKWEHITPVLRQLQLTLQS